jgi:ketosteroid isomerase-like protein
MTHFKTLALTVFLGVSLLALAQGPEGEGTTAQVRAAGRQVSRLDQEWADAERLGRTDYLNQLFSDDFVEVRSGGEVLGKQEQIDQVKGMQRQIKGIQLDKIQVLYASPTVVILSDTTTTESSGKGKESVSKDQNLRVFVKQRGRWHAAGAVATQLTEQ